MDTITGNFFDSSVTKVWAYKKKLDEGFVIMPIGVMFPIVYAPFDLYTESFSTQYPGDSMNFSHNRLQFKMNCFHVQGHIPYPSPFNGYTEFHTNVTVGTPLGSCPCNGIVNPVSENITPLLTDYYGFNLIFTDYGTRASDYDELFPFYSDLTEDPKVFNFVSTLTIDGVIFEYMPCDNNVRYIDIVHPGDTPDISSMDYDPNFLPTDHIDTGTKKPCLVNGFIEKNMIWDYTSNDWIVWDGTIPENTSRVIVYSKRYHQSVNIKVPIHKSHLYGENTDYTIEAPVCVYEGDTSGLNVAMYFGYYVPLPMLNISYGNNLSLVGWAFGADINRTPTPYDGINSYIYPYNTSAFGDGWRPFTLVNTINGDDDYAVLNGDDHSFLYYETRTYMFMPDVEFFEDWHDALHQSYLYIDLGMGIDEKLSVNFADKFKLNEHFFWGKSTGNADSGMFSWGLTGVIGTSEFTDDNGFCSGECTPRGKIVEQTIIIRALPRQTGTGDIIPILCYLCYRRYGRITPYGLTSVLKSLNT